MPLARILTAYPERAETLARELKDQGYNVEFLSPEKAGMLRADLEIDFEICDQKVVLRRAAELANKLHADIAVSPEALPANFVATESEIYVGQNQIVEVPSQMPDPYVETFLAQGERTGQIRNLENSEHMVSLPPDMLSENTLASASAEMVPPEQTHSQQPLSVIEPMAGASVNSEPMQARSEDPARMEDRSRIEEPRIEEPLRTIDVPIVPDPERHAEGTYGFETHGFENQSPAAQIHDPAMAHDRGPERVVRTSVVQTKKQEWIERAGALSSSALAAGKETSASLLASLRRFGGDCAEWINLRLAAAQDARHRRQMEAEKQRELARARAEELELARDAAAARLQELLRERGGLTDHQPIPPAAGPVPAYQSSEPSRLNRAANAGWFERIKDIALTRKYGQQWEAVLMGVAAACALFVVGVAVNSFRPHPALSNSISRPSTSAAPVAARAGSPNQPYNGVTVQGGKPGVTLLPSPVKTAPNPAPAATNKPSPRENDVTVRHLNNKLASRRTDGSIAQDVTIRHFNQQPKPAARNSADGVKRFSDLD
jgi:hypothetical protein